MLRHVIAPSRDFTQISNALVWDESLSDAAFRLLVRAVATPEAAARRTTVTALASGLAGGRITAERARKQLERAGLLHTTRWRGAGGRLRSESLVSNVPLSAAEAGRIFAAHFDKADGAGTTRPTPPDSAPDPDSNADAEPASLEQPRPPARFTSAWTSRTARPV